jgi:hypothetical protein
MINPLYLRSILITIIIFNFHFLYSQNELKLKRIIEVSIEGENIDTIYREYNERGLRITYENCFIETVNIDTIKISQDTIWENHIEWHCNTYQFYSKIKYSNGDTAVVLTMKSDTLFYTEKEFKIGYNKVKSIKYFNNNRYSGHEIIIDKSNPFRHKVIIKNQSKSVLCRLTNTRKLYHYSYKEQKSILHSKSRKRRYAHTITRYHKTEQWLIPRLFKIKSRTKYVVTTQVLFDTVSN